MGRVLVVDDDVDLRDLVAQWLRADGHSVLAVDDGPLAIAAVERSGPPDLAVLDVLLTGMDGVALLGHLRAHDPALPAIFLTVLWSGPDLDRLRVPGTVRIAKPTTGDELRSVVRRVLARRSAVNPGGTW